MYTEENNDGIYIERQVRVPGFSMHYEHFHNYMEIFYLKTGSCIYSVNNHLYHLTAGDVFLVAPGDSHSTSYEGLVPCEEPPYIVCRRYFPIFTGMPTRISGKSFPVPAR